MSLARSEAGWNVHPERVAATAAANAIRRRDAPRVRCRTCPWVRSRTRYEPFSIVALRPRRMEAAVETGILVAVPRRRPPRPGRRVRRAGIADRRLLGGPAVGPYGRAPPADAGGGADADRRSAGDPGAARALPVRTPPAGDPARGAQCAGPVPHEPRRRVGGVRRRDGGDTFLAVVRGGAGAPADP